MLKKVPVGKAVGMVLGHDVTRIVVGGFKGPAFKKGHIIIAQDIDPLRNLGKEHIYVLTLEPGQVHENDAALRIARAAAGSGLRLSEPSEGKVDLHAQAYGLLKVHVEGLNQINAIDEIVFATLHGFQPVTEGLRVAGTRIVPLVTDNTKVAQVEALCRRFFPLIEVKPFACRQVAIVTTGSEIYHGRIQDAFGPVLREKFTALGSQVMRQVFVSDDVALTSTAIRQAIDDGAQMVAVTGGMSVDPDDQTPASIRAAGGQVVAYGAPVLPGAMFMLAYIGDVPVLGLPGCVMYHRASIFDLVVPRLLAGEIVTRADIAAMGHGGLCAGCRDCRFPICGFGK
jgi:molybdopterin biosynthesis enzyme